MWASVIVVRRGPQFAVVARNFRTRDVNFPGGNIHVEEDTSPIDTAVRELHEETGLKVRPEWLTPLDTWTDPRTRRQVYAYLADRTQGRIRSSAEGKAFWTSQIQLLMRPTSTFHERNQELLRKVL